MIGFRPARPVGSSPEALFAQAVWDELWGGGQRFNDVAAVKGSRTTRGVIAIPARVKTRPPTG